MGGTRKLRTTALAALLGASIAGGVVLHRPDQPAAPKFCQASLPIREIEGRTVAIQDKDPDGSECDLAPTNDGMATLGLDCKIRASDGTVLATLKSTRTDGACGTDSPAP
jgi:hypothetical protein